MSSFKTKLLNGFAWRLCLYVSSFLLNIFITNNSGAERSGTFYFLLNNIAFAVLFMTFGLDSAVAYFTSRKEIGSKFLLPLSLCWSLAVVALLTFAYIILVQQTVIQPTPLAPYLILNIASTVLANCAASALFSSEDNRTPNIILTLVNITLIFLLPGNFFFKIWLLNEDYTRIYLLITSLPAWVLLAAAFLKVKPSKAITTDKGWGKKIISFGLRSFAYSLLYTLLLRCDYWLVNYFCSKNDLGNYLQATKFTQLILLVPTLASFSLFPLIVSHIQERKDIHEKLLKLVTIYFYIGLALCMSVAAFGYWVFPWLYGTDFLKVYPSFIFLSPGILMLAAAYPLSTFFSGKNLISKKIIALIYSIIIMLALDVFLIPKYSLYGAAAASTIAYTFYFLFLLVSFKKVYQFAYTDIFRITAILKNNMPGIFTKNKQYED